MVSEAVGAGALVTGVPSELTAGASAGLASDLNPGFEFRLSKLSLGPELVRLFGAALELPLEPTSVSSTISLTSSALTLMSNFGAKSVTSLESDSAVVVFTGGSTSSDWFWTD